MTKWKKWPTSIIMMTPNSNNCCLAGQKGRKVYYLPLLTLLNIFRRSKRNFWSLKTVLITTKMSVIGQQSPMNQPVCGVVRSLCN